MTSVLWLTDLHLNFLDSSEVDPFLERLSAEKPAAVLLGGDLGEAPSIIDYLIQFDIYLSCPVYFVLGNHDFYYGSLQEVRRQVGRLCQQRPTLVYLTEKKEPIELTSQVGLIGHDGWADARAGDFLNSEIMLNDYRLIQELSDMAKPDRRRLLHAMGDAAAESIADLLGKALENYEQVVLLTHVPPVREACWHQGRLSDDQWAPHFTCQAMGETIIEIMRKNPQRRLTVLCGHTHGAGETKPLDNLLVLTGGAEYGHPEIQRMFHFD